MLGLWHQALLPHWDPLQGPHLPPQIGPITFFLVRDCLVGQRVLCFGCYEATDPPGEGKDGQTGGGGSWPARGGGASADHWLRYSHAQVSQGFGSKDKGLVRLVAQLEHAEDKGVAACAALVTQGQPRAPSSLPSTAVPPSQPSSSPQPHPREHQ